MYFTVVCYAHTLNIVKYIIIAFLQLHTVYLSQNVEQLICLPLNALFLILILFTVIPWSAGFAILSAQLKKVYWGMEEEVTVWLQWLCVHLQNTGCIKITTQQITLQNCKKAGDVNLFFVIYVDFEKFVLNAPFSFILENI